MTDSEPVKSFEPEHMWVADAPIDDGWIEWKGGECAPADWDGGEVKFRDGEVGHSEIEFTPRDCLCWQNRSDPSDIIAYRVVKP